MVCVLGTACDIHTGYTFQCGGRWFWDAVNWQCTARMVGMHGLPLTAFGCPRLWLVCHAVGWQHTGQCRANVGTDCS